MKLPQIACFSLWGLTTFVATGLLLSVQTSAPQPLNHMGDLDIPSYARADIGKLFTLSAASAATAPLNASPAALRLHGIVFTNTTSQSRALVQTGIHTVRAFAVGSQLPNGAQLIEISKRHIVYEQDGTRSTLALPVR